MLTLITVTIIFRKKLLDWISNKRRNEHDKRIFEGSDALLGERALKNVLDYVGNNHSYLVTHMEPVSCFCRFFSEEQNQFLHKKLRNNSITLVEKLTALENFMALNFFPPFSHETGADLRLTMQPHLNIDRGGEPQLSGKYEQYREELNQLLDSATSAYDEYRRMVKQVLMI